MLNLDDAMKDTPSPTRMSQSVGDASVLTDGIGAVTGSVAAVADGFDGQLRLS